MQGHHVKFWKCTVFGEVKSFVLLLALKYMEHLAQRCYECEWYISTTSRDFLIFHTNKEKSVANFVKLSYD